MDWLANSSPKLVILVPLSIEFIDEFSEIPVWENSYGDETLDDVKIYFGVIDDGSGSPAAFSDLQVKDRNSGEKKWYPMEFDQQGNLIGGKKHSNTRLVLKIYHKQTVSSLENPCRQKL